MGDARVRMRPAVPADACAMAVLLNEIIAIGGTTAYEIPFDAESMTDEYICAENLISCTIAEDETHLLGFQGLFLPNEEYDLGDGWAFIATFVRVGLTRGGIGRQLFDETLKAARQAGIHTIDATIRADNASGLAFYNRIGFKDYSRKAGVPLTDGTPIDRVKKRFDL